jgi:hypothetical protein
LLTTAPRCERRETMNNQPGIPNPATMSENVGATRPVATATTTIAISGAKSFSRSHIEGRA